MITINKSKINPFSSLKLFQTYKSFGLLNLKGRKLTDSTENWLKHVKKTREDWN